MYATHIRLAALTVLGVLAAFIALGCTQTHPGPQDGTETGNPPSLNYTLIGLEVRADSVLVTGAAGAVSPPGTHVQVQSAFHGDVLTTVAATDGSFSVNVTKTPFDTFEVRAVSDGISSSPVYVVRGGSAITLGEGEGLSCSQREDLAERQLRAVVEAAHRVCTTDNDCLTVEVSSTCTRSCTTVAVSRMGETDVNDTRDAVEGGLCSAFSEQCSAVSVPCEGLGAASCVNGRCQAAATIIPTSRCTSHRVCADGTPENWEVCTRSSTTQPSSGLYAVCVVDSSGRIALTNLRGDLVIVNEGWTQSATALTPSTLSAPDEARCSTLKAQWDLGGGLGICTPRLP